MSKITLDKYYTPISVANFCWDKINDIIGFNNISYIIEPSAGNGAFSNYKIKPDLMIDIEPENQNIIKGDFLKYQIGYKKGTLIIGNPPFGERLKLARDFFNKSCRIADYIGFILPITQFNNVTSFYKFDLIASFDLGEEIYSGRKLHCCFNIYKRPKEGSHDFKKQHFNGITFYTQDRKDYENITDYDIRICYFGSGSCGNILTGTDKRYSGEYKIKIDDRHPQKQEIINIINTTDWKAKTNNISMKRLKQYMVFDELKKHGIKELEDKKALF